jgi:hypothetical protein
MLYPMLQRVVRECVEIEMKRPPEARGDDDQEIFIPSIIENHSGAPGDNANDGFEFSIFCSLAKLNFEFCRTHAAISHLSVAFC